MTKTKLIKELIVFRKSICAILPNPGVLLYAWHIKTHQKPGIRRINAIIFRIICVLWRSVFLESTWLFYIFTLMNVEHFLTRLNLYGILSPLVIKEAFEVIFNTSSDCLKEGTLKGKRKRKEKNISSYIFELPSWVWW